MMKKTLFAAMVIGLTMGPVFAQANLQNTSPPGLSGGVLLGGLRSGIAQQLPSGIHSVPLGPHSPGFNGGKVGKSPGKPDIQLGECSKGPC